MQGIDSTTDSPCSQLQSCGATELYRLREAAHGGTLPTEQRLRSAATEDFAVITVRLDRQTTDVRIATVLPGTLSKRLHVWIVPI